MKKLLALILIITALVFTWSGLIFQSSPEIQYSDITKASVIAYDPGYNFRQTSVECGAFSVAAVVRALTAAEVSSFDFYDKIEWKIPGKGVHPWGLEKLLKENNIKIEIPNLSAFNDEERIAFLKEQLSQGHPVILLGKQNDLLHYLTAFGFDSDSDEFYIYDSWHDRGENSMTIDDNGTNPGNRTLNSQELLEFWEGGGVFGFYEWYAIVSSA